MINFHLEKYDPKKLNTINVINKWTTPNGPPLEGCSSSEVFHLYA